MRWRITLLVLTLGLISEAQKKDLGSAGGLGVFKFGLHVSHFGDQITSDVRISYGQEYFIYNGPDADTFYGLKVLKTDLGFYRDSLNYIDFYFRKLDDASFASLKNLMLDDYGEPAVMDNADENGIIEAYRWISGDISLQLKRYGMEASDWGDRNMTVISCRLTDY